MWFPGPFLYTKDVGKKKQHLSYKIERAVGEGDCIYIEVKLAYSKKKKKEKKLIPKAPHLHMYEIVFFAKYRASIVFTS